MMFLSIELEMIKNIKNIIIIYIEILSMQV